MVPWEELRTDGRPPAAFWLGLGLKLGLVVLLLLPLLQPELEQYEGKGMSWRILVYPLAGVVVPLVWRHTGARAPYPYLADNLLVLPPLTDVLWNTLGAYDRIWWWDDANHLLNAMLFASVIGLLAGRSSLAPGVRFGLALGLATTLNVVWELGEYWVLIADLSSSVQGYEDTVGDLAFGLAGAALGAAFAVLAAGPLEEEKAEPEAVRSGS